MTTEDRASLVQDELEAALEAVAEHARVSGRLARALEEEERARAATEAARQELVSETADVRELESFSPTRIWAALRGSRDADLDRERAEQQAAEYAVARAEAWLQTAAQESQREAAALAQLGDVAERRERALQAKESWLTSTAHRDSVELTRLAEELAETRSALTEVREAVAAAEAAAGRLEVAGRTLGSAGDWATYDTFFGGGMLADMVKYDRIDKAQRILHDADLALRHLKVELADVGINVVVRRLDIDGLSQAFDVFFDNIFSDWSVRSRVSEAARATKTAADTVHQIRVRLGAEERALAEREATLVAGRERILTQPAG